MARKIKIRQSKSRKSTRSRRSRTYKGGSNNGTYSTTYSQYQNRTRMVQRELERARQLEASDSGHSRNRPGPGTLNPKISEAYNEYNNVIKGNARRE